MSVLIGSHIGALISVINVARKFWLVLKNLK